jgi:hypothetical protein
MVPAAILLRIQGFCDVLLCCRVCVPQDPKLMYRLHLQGLKGPRWTLIRPPPNLALSNALTIYIQLLPTVGYHLVSSPLFPLPTHTTTPCSPLLGLALHSFLASTNNMTNPTYLHLLTFGILLRTHNPERWRQYLTSKCRKTPTQRQSIISEKMWILVS